MSVFPCCRNILQRIPQFGTKTSGRNENRLPKYNETNLKQKRRPQMRIEETAALVLRRAINCGSKLHAKRRLDLPRATNSLVDATQPERAIIKSAGLVRGSAGGRQRCGS